MIVFPQKEHSFRPLVRKRTVFRVRMGWERRKIAQSLSRSRAHTITEFSNIFRVSYGASRKKKSTQELIAHISTLLLIWSKMNPPIQACLADSTWSGAAYQLTLEQSPHAILAAFARDSDLHWLSRCSCVVSSCRSQPACYRVQHIVPWWPSSSFRYVLLRTRRTASSVCSNIHASQFTFLVHHKATHRSHG